MLKQLITEKLNGIVEKYAGEKGLREKISFAVEIPPKNIKADYALNAAMVIAKKMKTNPANTARELIKKILEEMPEQIEKADMAGAGFINLRVKNDFLYKELASILRLKEKYGSVPANNKE